MNDDSANFMLAFFALAKFHDQQKVSEQDCKAKFKAFTVSNNAEVF